MPNTARARVRDELTAEILDAGRRQLAEHGSAALSLRAVAREVGMVSSAVYRYFPSRDDLLTALIVDSYSAVGEVAEQAEAAVRRGDPMARWLALVRAVRQWAVANPQQYALIFGSPIPGYAAPADTIDPAARIPLLLLAILADAPNPPAPSGPIPRPVRADLAALAAQTGVDLPEHHLALGIMAWTQLIGSISFELFGHLHNVVYDYPAYFDFQMRAIGRGLGLQRPG